MKVLFNNELRNEDVAFGVHDRAFQYGDGLFETMPVANGKVKYLSYHLERLITGAQKLNMPVPSVISKECESNIQKLLSANALKDAMVKLMVWRKTSTSGGYGFNNTSSNYLITCKPTPNRSKIIDQADFSETTFLTYSPISSIKTLNSLPYILAANEKQLRNLDELIVLNNHGFVCECVSSNVFWVKQDSYFTPPISSGCLDGVMRRVLIERLKTDQKEIVEKLAKPDELLEADVIFTTNSTGIRFIERIRDTSFDTGLSEKSLFTI